MYTIKTDFADLAIRTFAAGEMLTEEGAESKAVYVLKRGSVAVTVDGYFLYDETTPGTFFGEIAQILGRPQSATVKANEETECYVIDDLQAFSKAHLDVPRSIARIMAERVVQSDEVVRELRILLHDQGDRQTGVDGQLRELVVAASQARTAYEVKTDFVDLPVRSFAAGEVLLAEAEKPRVIYVLKSGRVRIDVHGHLLHEEAHPGIFFGEISTILGRGQSASITAAEPTECWEIADLDAFSEQHPEVSFSIARILCARVVESDMVVRNLRALLEEQERKLADRPKTFREKLHSLMVRIHRFTDGMERDVFSLHKKTAAERRKETNRLPGQS